MKSQRIDYPFFLMVVLLTAVGFAIFSSAALGLLARDGAPFTSVAANQVLFGIVGGGIAMMLLSRIDHKLLSKFAIGIFVAAFLLTLLTFVPHVGLTLKGAHRWIQVFGFSFQPAELLKLATVLLCASYFAKHHKEAGTVMGGLVPFGVIVGVAAVPFLLQPDHHGLMVLAIACTCIFFAAGGRVVHFLLIGVAGLVLGAAIVFAHPHAKDRVLTFIDSSRDPQGAGYQVQQSIIAIGSGQVFGRGFGQSIQKFSRLPEPIGDSVFAVASEEFGFVGATFLILLILAFTTTGLRIAVRAGDRFGGLLVIGIIMLISVQSFINIASIMGLFPLAGLPLTFVSQGGSALLVALAMSGIVLSVSRKIKTT